MAWMDPTATARYVRAVACESAEREADAVDEWRDRFVLDWTGGTRRCRCGGDAYRLLLAFTGDPMDLFQCEQCGEIRDGRDRRVRVALPGVGVVDVSDRR